MSTNKSVAIVQSNYVPWKGYFDLINSVDEFILYDDQQYTRRDWRNRNRIKTPSGIIWLSIPVNVKGKYLQRIDETEIADPRWAERHWSTLVHSYRKAPYFDWWEATFGTVYTDCRETKLSKVNRTLLEACCALLEIETKVVWSTDYSAVGTRTARLISLCREAGARTYLSGPSARAYIDEAQFEEAGIALRYIDYSGYREYGQLYPPFVHAVSVVDLLVQTGPDARTYLLSGSREA